MPIALPQARMPFSLNPLTGFPGVCEQDSVQDIASCVLNILSCPQGANPYDPNFGITQPTFAIITNPDLPFDVANLVTEVSRQETRLIELDASQAFDIVNNALTIVLTGYTEVV